MTVNTITRIYRACKRLGYTYHRCNLLVDPAVYHALKIPLTEPVIANPTSTKRRALCTHDKYAELLLLAAKLQHHPLPLRLFTYYTGTAYSQMSVLIVLKSNPLPQLCELLRECQLTVLGRYQDSTRILPNRVSTGDGTLQYAILRPNDALWKYLGIRRLTTVCYLKYVSNCSNALA